jgi:hypothetical protein
MLTAQVQRDQSFGACSKLNTPKLIEGEVQLIGIRQRFCQQGAFTSKKTTLHDDDILSF